MSLDDRMAEVEAEVAELRAAVRASGDVRAILQPPIPIRLARTTVDAEDDIYPEQADTPNTYPIIFLDGTYTRESGDQDPSWTDRQKESQAVAQNMAPIGNWVPEDTIVAVFASGNRFWFFHLTGDLLGKTTGTHAAGVVQTVNLWDGPPGSETVSSPLVTVAACNRTSVVIPSAKFVRIFVMNEAMYCEPKQC